MPTDPRISVIIATYNRSRVLARAVDSVRRSTIEDWETIVAGDHCTDDTAEVVASFDDPRITFVNLPRNSGEQSGPHNEAIGRVRGRHIAYLNHDDLYFPDHLATASAFLDETGADLVWVPLLVALPSLESDLVAGRATFRLSGVPVGEDYDPRVFVFASAWVLTHDLALRVGRWRAARETFVSSSQDWLFRAWRMGARMRFLPKATVLAVPAGAREGSYAGVSSPEHDYFAWQMQMNPRFRAAALESASVAGEREANRYRFGQAWFESVRALLYRPVSAAAVRMGVHPNAPYFALRYGRKGNLISATRRRTGLQGLAQRPSGRGF
jgi:hypothetical protein